MPNAPYQYTLHFIHAHIDMLDHTAIEHTSWNVPVTTFLLKFTQAP
ncbi:MAG: hypothetical protein MI807_00730 [Verrucomicrobiales bacterium]|nr:hypothetical protein [Verrucomicrobiales bacterium]